MRSVPSLRNLIPEENNMNKTLRSLLLSAMVAALPAAAVMANETPTLRIATEGAYPPFNYFTADGKLAGFDIEIGRALCAKMQAKCTFVAQDWDGIIPALLTNKFDMIGSGMTLTQERNLRLNFSDPFIVVGQTLLIRKDLEGKIKIYKDLNDPQYRITSKIGTTGEMVAKKLISKAKYNGFDNEQEAVLDVVNGKADAFIYDAPYNVVAVNKAGAGKLVYLDEPFTYEPLAFGLKKGDYDSINWINNWLQQIRHDGTYDRLHAKWFKSSAWLKDME